MTKKHLKKILECIEAALLYVWQLPQNILGIIVAVVAGAEHIYPYVDEHGIKEYIICTRGMHGGVSLGKYIIVYSTSRYNVSAVTKAHEYGHARQSRMLGWLYLVVVGIWSGVRCGFHMYKRGSYYDAYPENWADRLGEVYRDDSGSRQTRREI